MLITYDVALWLTWSPLWPEVVEMVEAESPATAVLLLMQKHALSKVLKAAVHAPDGMISRWWRVEQPACEEV